MILPQVGDIHLLTTQQVHKTHQNKYKMYSFYLCNSPLQLKGYPDCRIWEGIHWNCP